MKSFVDFWPSSLALSKDFVTYGSGTKPVTSDINPIQAMVFLPFKGPSGGGGGGGSL